MEYSRRPTEGIPKENQLKILNKIYETLLGVHNMVQYNWVNAGSGNG